MPGLTLVAGSGADARAVEDAIRRVARPHDRVEVLFEIPNALVVAWCAAEGYPKDGVTDAAGFAVLEGRAPALSAADLRAQLKGLLQTLHHSLQRAYEETSTWAAACEGDFVLVLASRASRCAIIATDGLGRLRPYAHRAGSHVAFAREIKTLLELYGPGTPDRVALGQILTFGFPLGDRTPVAEIRSTPAAMVARIDLASFACRTSTYKEWNFEALAQSGPRTTPAELAECFRETCARQASFENRPVILSLSGGLDSRAVAAALMRSNVGFDASTFTTADGAFNEDLAIAKTVARTLGVVVKHRLLATPTWSDRAEIVELRDGLNDMAMAAAIEYLKLLRSEYGSRALYFSGDGGDKVLRDLRAPWWTRSFDSFVRMRMERVCWPIEIAAKLCGVNEAALRAESIEHLRSYPERSGRYCEVHFLMVERGMGWVREGEERNRSFLWHQTPFFGKAFFELSMSIHPKEKRGDRLRQELVTLLQPRLAGLATANRASRWQLVMAQLPPGLRNVLRQGRRMLPRTATVSRRLPQELQEILRNDAVREIFAGVRLEEALQTAAPRQYDLLATQMLNVARVWGATRNVSVACSG